MPTYTIQYELSFEAEDDEKAVDVCIEELFSDIAHVVTMAIVNPPIAVTQRKRISWTLAGNNRYVVGDTNRVQLRKTRPAGRDCV